MKMLKGFITISKRI